jgi:hypothetical protein
MNNLTITKEQFNKLPQLDRIEFRQKMEYIERNKVDTNPFSFLNTILVLAGFCIIVGLLLMEWNFDSGYNLIYNTLPFILKVGFIGFLFLIFLNIIFSQVYKKHIKNLEEEYFKIEVKNKR